MSGYSRGPLTVCHGVSYWPDDWGIVDPNGEPIGRTAAPRAGGKPLEGASNEEANARLWAAAPDLAEACQSAMVLLADNIGDIDTILASIRAALTKAGAECPV